MAKQQLGEIISCSIGTAIPLEKILTGELSIKGYTHLYVNLRTLHRNYHGSFSALEMPAITLYIKGFMEEILTIYGIIKDTLPGNITPIFYISTGKSLGTVFPKARIKQKFTDKQTNFLEMEKLTILKTLAKMDNVKNENYINIHTYDVLIKGFNTSSLIITHYPRDLLSYYSFRRLALLESHTGVLKTRTEWITKITKNPAALDLPFNGLTLQLLGDKGNEFEGYGKKVTDALVTISKENRWTPLTTMEKCKFDIRKLKDKFLAETLLAMAVFNLK